MKYGLLLIACLWSPVLLADQKAVTDEGDIVILRDDGSWVYESPEAAMPTEIPTNDQVFSKPEHLTFSLKSTKNTAEVWLDTKKWAFKKGAAGEATEYSFQLKGEDLYGMLLTEQISMSMDNLTEIALQNAREAAPDMRISKREYRTVNGVRAIYMEMQGITQGADFTFSGYYYSDESGTTQFLTYTGTNLIRKYEAEINSFLSGFAVR